MDSSTPLRPSTTSPSTGMRSPGRTRTSSPTRSARSGTTVSSPSLDPRRHLGLEIEQALGRGHRAAARDRLQIASDQDDEEKVDHRVPVDRADRGTAQGDVERVAVGRGDTDGDRQIHAQVTRAQPRPGASIEGRARIQQGRRRQQAADPVEEIPELAPVRAAVERDRDPHEVHHRKPGPGEPEQQVAILPADGALGGVGIKGGRGVAEIGKPAQDARELEPTVIPAHAQPTAGEIDPRLLDAGQRLQSLFDQPDTGRAVDALDQQVDLAAFAGDVGELLLHRVEVEDGEIPGRLGRRSQNLALRGAPIEALQSGGMDGLADRLATGAAEGTLAALDKRRLPRGWGNRQATVKAAAGDG